MAGRHAHSRAVHAIAGLSHHVAPGSYFRAFRHPCLPRRVCLWSGEWRRPTDGRKTKGKKGKDAVVVLRSVVTRLSRSVKRRIFGAKFANCVKRTNANGVSPPRVASSRVAICSRRGGKVDGAVQEMGSAVPTIDALCFRSFSLFFSPSSVAAEFRLRLNCASCLPAEPPPPPSIHLCRPPPTGFSLRMSRRMSKPASWVRAPARGISAAADAHCSDNRTAPRSLCWQGRDAVVRKSRRNRPGPGPRFNWMRLCGAQYREMARARQTAATMKAAERASEAARRRRGGGLLCTFETRETPFARRERERSISQSRRYCYVALTRISV